MGLEWEISNGQRDPASLIAPLFLSFLGPEVCVVWMAGPLRVSTPPQKKKTKKKTLPWLGLVCFFSGPGSDFLGGQAPSTMTPKGHISVVSWDPSEPP